MEGKITSLTPIPELSPEDVFVIVDKSNTSESPTGKTSKCTSHQVVNFVRDHHLTGFLSINGALIKRTIPNNDTNNQIPGDIMIYKEITNNGNPMVLMGHTFLGGDEQLRSSYNKLIPTDI